MAVWLVTMCYTWTGNMAYGPLAKPAEQRNRRPGLGICSYDFRANRSFFAQKWANEWFTQKNERFTHSLIFGEWPERFAHDRTFPLSDVSKMLIVAHFWWATWANCSFRSFLVSDLSDLLTSLRGNEWLWGNCSHCSPKKRIWAKISDSLIFQ